MANSLTHSIWYVVRDAKGNRSRFEIDIPIATSVPNVIVFAEQAGPIFNALINGGLEAAGVSLGIDVTGWGAAAEAISDVQEKAQFVFRTANGFLKRISLPAVVETIFASGSAQVDLANVDVQAFVALMTDGADNTAQGGGIVIPSDTRGEDLTALDSAHEAWGSYRG